LFELVSFFRVIAAAVVYGGIELRYVNRNEADWTRKIDGFYEKPVLWKYTRYHVLFVLPLFIVISYTGQISAWAANVFLVAFVEDVAYFAWRKKMVLQDDWTAQLFGSFKLGGVVVPIWWPLDLLIALLFYSIPFF
jgi:hypothetical protein